MQFESRALPTIGPIQIQQQTQNETNGPTIDVKSTFFRSGSVGTLYDNSHSNNETNNNRPLGNKLPALLLPPQQITGSLDDCKYFLLLSNLVFSSIYRHRIRILKICTLIRLHVFFLFIANYHHWFILLYTSM